MEKFGVVQREDSVKTAEDVAIHCPTCGEILKDVAETGGVRICRKCGTKPFEEEV